ncbi:NRAMP family divalent metal transporter [Sphingomonas sp. PAMC 26617]|uniref:NRAMP family divalent metal transporter n=1 Tax=Sphingomonas sp. PAMC 26617 TaxID=1112216 RepID=UPI001E624676|nr:divalent metal cation transporter [Sphingomonas sp. PAMC 26617]
MTGAADDDPSGIATYSQAGAQFGYALGWTMILTFPLMSAIQLISARIGRVTGRGLAGNMEDVLARPVVTALVTLLFVANTINIGADLAAMGAAAELVTGLSAHATTVGFALLSLVLQIFVPYRRYSKLLKWLTLTLFAYVALVFIVPLDWKQLVAGLVIPRINGRAAVITIVAVFGTTISPYLFFWQSAQEVEGIAGRTGAKPLRDAPEQAQGEFHRMRFDTLFGMAVSNLVALAIIIGTAATLHATGTASIETAADAAKALRPVAGPFAFLLFSFGIIGTGLLAVPVLAGSAAYAVSDTRKWHGSLDDKPRQAIGFYSVIGLATVLGIGIDWSPLDPIKALFWSAVINGVVAVPIMAAMMLVVSRRQTMGDFTASPILLTLGWTATVLMAMAAAALAVVS